MFFSRPIWGLIKKNKNTLVGVSVPDSQRSWDGVDRQLVFFNNKSRAELDWIYSRSIFTFQKKIDKAIDYLSFLWCALFITYDVGRTYFTFSITHYSLIVWDINLDQFFYKCDSHAELQNPIYEEWKTS